jgi:hypothetical protein
LSTAAKKDNSSWMTMLHQTTNLLQKFLDLSKTSKDANKPADLILDHQQADNPYLSLCGEKNQKVSDVLGVYLDC